MKIYTKTGDKGETGLLGGKRVDKNCLEIQLIGEVDELNASLGAALVSLRGEKRRGNLRVACVLRFAVMCQTMRLIKISKCQIILCKYTIESVEK